ncbi:methyl-accepting chemotaxis protein [Clostridium sp. UBA4548]|uniref:methyl-accepting chemotaxis protein n=1 Tax=Clostridium sp. UBA4548 TaxID=1946361 RepID=UPI0025C2E8DE|nr:methyl-accepting chemotaxis protein [Clostridium sp. UBA4548]
MKEVNFDSKSLDNQSEIKEISDTLFGALQQTNASSEEISSTSQDLSLSIDKVIELVNQTSGKIDESNSLITLIQGISKNSNLLGLNASIEASRAGSEGAGFNIIAKEMRKLAQSSTESAEKISRALSDIKAAIDLVVEEINKVGLIASSQAASTEEITATLQEITSTAQLLVNKTIH